ncbi:MAG: hypothetical protein IJM41_06260 [Bacteroidales bacterium]|nr:hypothetical protein [Bacteroidales bacterium]
MNNTIRWAVLALLAGCLSSCATQQEFEAPVPGQQKNTLVHFTASPLQTRTAFAEPEVEDGIASYPTLWTDNDTEVAISLNLAPAIMAGVIPSEDYTKADFDADFSEVEATAPYTFYVLSPASALQAVSPSRKALTFNIPTVQTPLATSADEAAQLLVAKSGETTTIPEKVDVRFSHLTGYGRLTLKNLPGSAEVSSVTLVSPEQPWAGSWYYSTENGSVEAKEASSSITVKSDASGDIWFACAPVDMKGKKLRISAATAEGTYEREITLTGKNVNFTSGYVYKFSVNMENATFVENKKEVYYELVTDASTLKDGDEVIIANVLNSKVTSYYAISTTQNTNNRGQVAVEVEDSKIYDPDKTVEIFTLASKSSGTWGLKTHDDKYLYITSGSNDNYLRSSTNTNQAGSAWTISIASNGTATVTATNTYTKTLWYNSQNSWFSAYRADQSTNTRMVKVALYRKTEGAAIPSSNDPILQEETFGAYLNGDNRLYTKGTQQLSREYTGTTVTFAILDQTQNSIYEFSGIPAAAAMGESFSLTYNEIRGKKTASSTTYAVTVVGEAGAKLWLSDGAGNGFIVKR